ncbi:MAG: hypothetical protein HFJ75_04395 [Eggerthellaceae bacterium]|nr:hypothetical protein [Eggerthellaceae bacterium]
MDLNMPRTPREEEAERIHEDEKREHREDRREDELHKPDDKAYREMKEAKEVRDARIGHDEKADRRQQDEHDAALVEEANAVLDPQAE